MLAQDLKPVLMPSHEVLALDHSACDITDEDAVQGVFTGWRPDLVVNCAAYADVDGCDRDPERAFAVNGRGPGNLARAAGAVGARLFHISTDYVFDGRQQEPYLEQDAPHPINLYGQSKLEGEQRILGLDGGEQHLIIRPPWLYGFARTNFVEKILEAAQVRDQVEAVADQLSCLTWTVHLAQGILELIGTKAAGILHLAGGGQCSRYESAQRIVEHLPRPVSVLPITWDQLHLAAKRPAYSVLRSGRLAELGLQPLPDWKVALDEYLRLRHSLMVGASEAGSS